MKPLLNQLPRITLLLLAAFIAALSVRSWGETTVLLVLSSILMFGCCWASASHLLGPRPALRFVIIGIVLGWIAEELGAQKGWFFGSYTYTDVLGPRIGSVPFIIPLMWFALCYVAYVIANLIVWQTPTDGAPSARQSMVMSFIAAMIVTAYDLGADPYMVFTLKAWIMTKTDGGWFGETLQGFVGWMAVSFAIIYGFRATLRGKPAVASSPVTPLYALVPLIIYGGSMAFQAVQGSPIETRTIALFAMGIPLLTALCGWTRWRAAA
ncbi:carotenoid biosynthesis protein [Pseudoduganella violaceinigra]|uniref:carotenoid biosynthesis protein n=1 Tax=Pseudoduganella violaceinigra TaxID=246602 RepID=UPI0003F661E9|nr:carotenoid biosynthesis protein [Pseudoduganella violaceinigra]